MKVSTLFATALLAIAPLTNALPPSHYEDNHISSAAQYMPIDKRDIHDGPVIRGAGALQEAHLQRRNVNNQRITGVRVGYSGAYRVYRQEIRKFVNDRNGRLLDLFVLALDRMYKRPSNDVNSFWQLAGIHGRPFQGWAGDSSGSWNQNGYCTHGSTLFPTWHRPYLAYFEEVVWANAEYIVNNQIAAGSLREDYRAALMVLRLPYYDWAQNSDLPEVFTQSTYRFRRNPGSFVGDPNTFRNPLFASYLTASQISAFRGEPWTFWTQTKRAPTNQNSNAQSDNARVGAAMRAQQSNLRQRTYQLLINNHAWNTFSNRASGANGGQAYDSLESIHDTVHGTIGLNGHMSFVEYSAMDPIFFIHHVNVDRLFAIWQAINPTTYVTSQVNRGGTYGVPPQTVEYRTSILRPFKGLSGEYWTSDGVRDTSLFGYGYFETPKWKYSKATENQYAAAVRKTVEGLYGNSVSSASTRKRDVGNATEAGIDASINNNKYYEWRINIVADKSDANGTYFVHFFLGKPSKNPADWYTQPELVGDYVCFTHDHQAAPGMDPSMIDNTVTGSVPLTDAMVKAFPDTDLNSLQPTEAVPFLIKNLRWRATDNAGNPIRIRKLKGLKVSVSINLVTLPSNEVPWRQFGEWELLTEISRKIGRDGGPDKVNVIPDLSSSAAPATSTTAAPAASTTEAADEATTSEVSTTSEAPTSTEESAPAETTA